MYTYKLAEIEQDVGTVRRLQEERKKERKKERTGNAFTYGFVHAAVWVLAVYIVSSKVSTFKDVLFICFQFPGSELPRVRASRQADR